ncbi:uncharacterized protein V1510DRAFT_278229 [Dipodascopsis tothii]|uniref:uncharacterized protein n=1 Tax=Dipodascopsis tothii TaxID=44089 RepID=UPI0034CDC4FE
MALNGDSGADDARRSALMDAAAAAEAASADGATDAVLAALKDMVLPLLQQRAKPVRRRDNEPRPQTALLGVHARLDPADQDEILAAMDPATWTACWVLALLSRPAGAPDEWLTAADRLCAVADADQLQLVAAQVHHFADMVVATAAAAGRPAAALQPLRSLVLRFSADGSTLSPAHAQFAAQCLATGRYLYATGVLDRDVTVFSNKFGVTYLDHLLYHYYGAQILAGLRRYGDAEAFLAITISAPISPPSLSQVEAYKKHVLLNLIVRGKIAPASRLINETTLHTLKTIGRPYEHFARAFESGDVNALQTTAEQLRAIFAADANEGLVQQVLMAFRKRQLARLPNTYVSVPLAYAERVDSDFMASGVTTEGLLQQMIDAGELQAQLVYRSPEAQPVILFRDTKLTKRHVGALSAKIDAVRLLNERMIALDRAVGMSREYQVNRLYQSTGAGSMLSGRGGLAAVMAETDLDEDVIQDSRSMAAEYYRNDESDEMED